MRKIKITFVNTQAPKLSLSNYLIYNIKKISAHLNIYTMCMYY